MSRAYSTNREKKMHIIYSCESQTEEQDVGRSIILKWIKHRMGWYDLD
jgi:hypothetical protein